LSILNVGKFTLRPKITAPLLQRQHFSHLNFEILKKYSLRKEKLLIPILEDFSESKGKIRLPTIKASSQVLLLLLPLETTIRYWTDNFI